MFSVCVYIYMAVSLFAGGSKRSLPIIPLVSHRSHNAPPALVPLPNGNCPSPSSSPNSKLPPRAPPYPDIFKIVHCVAKTSVSKRAVSISLKYLLVLLSDCLSKLSQMVTNEGYCSLFKKFFFPKFL